MKSSLIRTIAFLAGLAFVAPAVHAEDIDIFGGVGGSAVPNILFVMDSRASNDASVSPYTCTYAPLSNGKMLDMVQCALYMAVAQITSQPALSGKLKIAMMKAGPQWYYPANAPFDFQLMDPTGVTNLTSYLANTPIKSPGNGSLGDQMWEAYAFLTGHTGPAGIAYSPHIGTLSCQKSFIIMIGNVDPKHSNPSNAPGGQVSDLQNAIPTPTATQLTQINTKPSVGPDNGEDASSIDEWSRYLYQTDFNNNANDKQGAVTYTIGTYGSDGIWADKAQEMQSAANQGGGKAFLVNNLGAFTTVINQIFNEIAAVNSVFSSSSLPVSANTQGTYLNQIFIGMFRPDGSDNPRWLGNLKQYQFGVSGTTANPTLFLADSLLHPALTSSGTGFITPTAVSFWTSKDTSTLPDSIGGYFVNNPQGVGLGFDREDGEFVEKGGVAQRLRMANLTDDYTTNPHSPRNLYTCNGSCTGGSSLSGSPFATDNANITNASFNITGPTSTVSSISRNGTTVTVVLSAAPATALTNGQNVTMTGASNIELNGNFTITLINSTTFKYTIVESPPTPSTGAYKAYVGVANPKSIVSLTRVGAVVTATLAAAHGYNNNQLVTISGASQTEYNGTFQIATSGPSSTTFTYTMQDSPRVASTTGTADIGSTHTNSISFTSITRTTTASDGTSIVTVTDNSNLANAYVTGALVNVSGVTPSDWNVTLVPILFGGGNSQGDQCPSPSQKKAFCFKITTTPVNTATGTLVVDSTTYYDVTFTHTASCTASSPAVTVTGTATGTIPSPTPTAISITGTPGPREAAYIGNNIPITSVSTVSGGWKFNFASTINTTPPCSPSASGVSAITGPTSLDLTSLVNWVRGQDNVGDELSPGTNGITVRPSIHGDVLHSRPVVVNYAGSIGIVVFYGANDGVFRAINGNQPLNGSPTLGGAPPGGEVWGFIPTEFFTRLPRLYTNSPMVKLSTTPNGFTPTPTPKDYFFDGPTGVYQDTSTSTVSLFLSMRRGGRMIYALNVNDPTDPKFLWKISNTGSFAELGYTWSTPKAARVRGWANPVVIFGGGYDTNEDAEPPTADTMGRGIFVVDATNGALVWSATFGSGNTGSCTGSTSCRLTDMTYAFPADVALINRDYDTNGYIDRIYAADIGGNIWRVDLEPAGYATANPLTTVAPSTWKVTKFASVGGSGTTKRKMFFPPDVVATKNFDMVLAVTGDREHPMYSAGSGTSYTIVNRFYGLKDTKTGADAGTWTAAGVVTDGTTGTDNTANGVTGMSDATTTAYDPTTANNGFYIRLTNAGEKGVNAPTTVGGFTYFGTSTPPAPSAQACNNLGTARGYQVDFLTGASGSVTFDGGGLPPSPVAGLVNVSIGGTTRAVPFCLGCGSPSASCSGPDCKSSLGGIKPPIPVKPIRKRVYWYVEKHDK